MDVQGINYQVSFEANHYCGCRGCPCPVGTGEDTELGPQDGRRESEMPRRGSRKEHNCLTFGLAGKCLWSEMGQLRGESRQGLFGQQLLLADPEDTDFIPLAVMKRKKKQKQSMLEKQMSDTENNRKVKGKKSSNNASLPCGREGREQL